MDSEKNTNHTPCIHMNTPTKTGCVHKSYLTHALKQTGKHRHICVHMHKHTPVTQNIKCLKINK